MLSEDLQYLSNDPWAAIFPGLAIVIVVASLGIIADGLRDATGVTGTVVRLVGNRVLRTDEVVAPLAAPDDVTAEEVA
jgi:hypothetical protein